MTSHSTADCGKKLSLRSTSFVDAWRTTFIQALPILTLIITLAMMTFIIALEMMNNISNYG